MGKVRRILVALVALLMMNLQVVDVCAQTVVTKALLAEQTKGKAPNIKVYMTGSDMVAEVSVSGVVSDVELTQNGDIKTFEESGEGIRYIILFDNSGSINKAQFEEAKAQLVNWRKKMKESDEMQLYTVGTTDVSSNKVDVLGRTVLGSETDKEKSDSKKIKQIEYIGNAAGKTILYRSLNEVLEEQAVQCSMDSLRTVVLLITDGEDDSDDVKGKNNDKDDTLENVKQSLIPVYGILLNNSSKKPNEAKIKFTKNKILNPNASHGYYYNCSSKTNTEAVEKAFKKLKSIFFKETFVVNLSAETNKKVVGKSELNLAVNNQSIDPVLLDYSDYEKDDNPPIIVGSVKKEGKNSILFSIEDENGVNLDDAKDKTKYIIETKTKEKNGKKGKKEKKWTIAQVNANKDGNTTNVTLTVSDAEFYNGNYTLIIDGIQDESEDQNKMLKVKASFEVKDGLNAGTEAFKEGLQKYWWIGLIIIVVIIGIIIIIFVKKKSVKIVEVNPDELNKADSRMIRLTITDRSGAIKEVEWNVEGSLFVGRSDICNIYFDDDRLSKQHFVIEVTKMGCYIEDLESTNGTFVNGVKMTNRRLLLDEDVITAGREKIVIHIDKNQMFMDEE